MRKVWGLQVLYCRRHPALSGAPITFEPNSEKWLGWAGCLDRRGLGAERVKPFWQTKYLKMLTRLKKCEFVILNYGGCICKVRSPGGAG